MMEVGESSSGGHACLMQAITHATEAAHLDTAAAPSAAAEAATAAVKSPSAAADEATVTTD